MKFTCNQPFAVFGDKTYRGDCPPEAIEQISFFNWVRREYPDYGSIAIHPRNEQQLRNGQFTSLRRHKAEGMTPGAADIIIPAERTFVCELKRQDHTKSKWQPGQIGYLTACYKAGAFVCVALGYSAAKQAFLYWLATSKKPRFSFFCVFFCCFVSKAMLKSVYSVL